MHDMTHGNIPRAMLSFTLPLLLGNLFQQLYNLSDTVIVGQTLGKEALAAVGTAGAAMNLMLFVLVGMTLGISVLLSELFGAGDEGAMKRAYGSALFVGTGMTVALSVVSMMFSGPILVLIQTPEAVLPEATNYLRVVCGGLTFAFLYNAGASALRAIGDTRAPLMFLIVSVVLNIGLDLLFIISFHMGTAGAALATAIAQALSGICCLVYIQKKQPMLRLGFGRKIMDGVLLMRTAKYAVTCAVQQMVLYAGRMLVQGAVNPLGVVNVAAFNGVTKIDGLILAPGDSLAMAQTTFTSQNIGAGERERPRQALRIAITMGLSFCAVVAACVFVFAGPLMRLFVEGGEVDVIGAGMKYLRMMAPFYLLTALCNAYQGLFRGLGRMDLSLCSTFIQIPVRIVLSYLLAPRMGLSGVALAVGIGWCCMVTFIIPTGDRVLRQLSGRMGRA